MRKKPIARRYQKQKIKRKYAAEARETTKKLHQMTGKQNIVLQIVRFMKQFAIVKKTAVGFIASLVLLFVLALALFSSCGVLLSGISSAIFSTCYLADDDEITQADLFYSELEAELQRTVDTVEETYPGYDRYRYHVGEISHNPYELMAYLTVKYGAFTFEEIRPALHQIFGKQYYLDIHSETETRYRSDGTSYTITILVTTVKVTPLSRIFGAELSGVDKNQYDVLIETCGNRQAFGNPFPFPWLAYVESPFGYRIVGETSQKQRHDGIDILAEENTPVRAIQDGTVTGMAYGDYGLMIVIEDENGYQSRYGYCTNQSVKQGQEVKRGDIIAEVEGKEEGEKGVLHLEVLHNGQYLNPYFFVDTGGTGSQAGNQGPVIPGNPGGAMGDGSFEALIREGEKYLGFPYVWGGSTPQTSFDCSGFVCWVYTHSGVYNLPRTTAQGIFNQCTPVSGEDARPGDLVFFTKTYSSPNPVTHVGIYVGNGQMLHCGDPIGYTSIHTSYWKEHFYSFGRLNR